jgi:Zn-dependent M28 family amino/carboxypeptidase
VTAIEKDLVARLSGHTEIGPGLKLEDRFTLENRQAARVYLKGVWRGLGLDVQGQDYTTEGQNLYSVLKATVPSEENIVLGAHYDTVSHCPGANDNATGVALVTAVAAELSKTTPRSRNLIFVLFDEEERALRGSRAFAQKLRDEGLKVHAIHTVDQMGWDQDHDRAIELELPYEGAEALYEKAAKALSMPIPIHVTQEAGADHSAFRKLGFQAVGLTEEYRNKDTTPHIHRPGDSFDTVQFDYLASTTRLVVGAMRMLVQ